MPEGNKKKFALWAYPQTMEQIKKVYKEDNCQSKSEFIEKAIEFYLGHISSNENTNYLCDVITTTIEGIISNTENRLSRLQFKEAVELAKLSKLISMMLNYDEDIIKQIHIDAVNEVKKINGFIDYRPFKG